MELCSRVPLSNDRNSTFKGNIESGGAKAQSEGVKSITAPNNYNSSNSKPPNNINNNRFQNKPHRQMDRSDAVQNWREREPVANTSILESWKD